MLPGGEYDSGAQTVTPRDLVPSPKVQVVIQGSRLIMLKALAASIRDLKCGQRTKAGSGRKRAKWGYPSF